MDGDPSGSSTQATAPVPQRDEVPVPPFPDLKSFMAAAHKAGFLGFLNHTMVAASFKVRKQTVIEMKEAEASRTVPASVPASKGGNDGEPEGELARVLGSLDETLQALPDMLRAYLRSDAPQPQAQSPVASQASSVPGPKRIRRNGGWGVAFVGAVAAAYSVLVVPDLYGVVGGGIVALLGAAAATMGGGGRVPQSIDAPEGSVR
ncbi:MAG: hypothetical protein KGI26_07085 [Thaumarchaeota archaeon]|nr:hypothetical protein [Nitrososphaerota archaeon]